VNPTGRERDRVGQQETEANVPQTPVQDHERPAYDRSGCGSERERGGAAQARSAGAAGGRTASAGVTNSRSEMGTDKAGR
jgi:hypothetical protein